MREEDCAKLFKNGTSKLKTGFFAFKFKPDYLGAVDDFTQAAKGYRHLGLTDRAITSYLKAIECNHGLNDYWAEGKCYTEIADIYFYDLKNAKEGIENLKKASYSYQVSGKFTFAVKGFVKTAEKYLENKEYEVAETILLQAFELCKGNVEDKLISGTFEEIYNKLLDVECGMGKWREATKYTKEYIEAQMRYPEKDKYRLSKSFMKLCILHIINKEEYLVEEVFNQMFSNKYEDTLTDMDDIQKLLDSLKTMDKKKFNFCVGSAFTLFENNLLKGLQTLYKEKEMKVKQEEEEKEGGNKNEIKNDNANNINNENNDKVKSQAEDDDIL